MGMFLKKSQAKHPCRYNPSILVQAAEKVPFRGYWNIKYVAVRCDFVSSGCEVSASKEKQ